MVICHSISLSQLLSRQQVAMKTVAHAPVFVLLGSEYIFTCMLGFLNSFRVAAIDHDIFSFVDVRLHKWPIILITNPKDAHYLMPAFEPIGRIKKSTHIR